MLFAWLLWKFGRRALIAATIWAVVSLLSALAFLAARPRNTVGECLGV